MHLVVRQASSVDFEEMMRLCRGPDASRSKCFREWASIWNADSTVGVVVEDISLSRRNSMGLMVATFVTDGFLQTAVAAKEPDLLHRLAMEPSAFVPTRSFGSLNQGTGANMLVAYMGWVGEDYHVDPAPSLRAITVNSFIDRHGGNRLRWMFGEVSGNRQLELWKRTGLKVLNSYPDFDQQNVPSAERPYLVGISRDDAMHVENQWLQRTFTYFPPKFYFTEPQRMILLLAREGYTDAEVGIVLGVSADAVKKRWSAIYDRVEEVFPNILPESPLGLRGVEKRRALLAHLRERPEELRPHDRRR